MGQGLVHSCKDARLDTQMTDDDRLTWYLGIDNFSYQMSGARFLRTIVCVLLLCNAVHAADEPTLTIAGDLPPIRATYSDLAQLAKDLEELASHPKTAALNCSFVYYIRGEGTSLADKSLSTLLASSALPNPAKGFGLVCHAVAVRLGKVSDYEITGADNAFLFAMKGRIEEFAANHKTRFGGAAFQVAVFFLLMLVSLPLFLVALRARTHRVANASVVAILIIIVASFFFFMAGYLEAWFPQTAIYKESASFIERNNATITFWSLIVGLVGLFISSRSFWPHEKPVVPPGSSRGAAVSPHRSSRDSHQKK